MQITTLHRAGSPAAAHPNKLGARVAVRPQLRLLAAVVFRNFSRSDSRDHASTDSSSGGDYRGI